MTWNPCCVRVYRVDCMFRQCACRQGAGSRQCSGLGHQIRGSPVRWGYIVSHLVFQRLQSAQTASGDIDTCHGPCLLVTPSEQRLAHQTYEYIRYRTRKMRRDFTSPEVTSICKPLGHVRTTALCTHLYSGKRPQHLVIVTILGRHLSMHGLSLVTNLLNLYTCQCPLGYTEAQPHSPCVASRFISLPYLSNRRRNNTQNIKKH